VIATVDKLGEADLMKILIEPRNALTKQYQKLFEIDHVDLEFPKDFGNGRYVPHGGIVEERLIEERVITS